MIDRIREKSKDGVTVFAPAKINLFLSVTSKRPDGYHELATVMGKLGVGDLVRIQKNSQLKNQALVVPALKNWRTRKISSWWQ